MGYAENNISRKLFSASHDSPGHAGAERGSMTGKAQRLFNRIGYGRGNMIPRPSDEYTDRSLRKLINEANKKGDCIINAGNGGYYRPRPGNTVEEKELNEYLLSELHRARDILVKRLSMKRTFERWRECGILLNNTDKTG